MTFSRRVAFASVSAAAMVLGMSAGALAQTQISGGGATLPSLVLRDMFNCYGVTVDNAAGDFTNAAACNDTISVTNRIFGYASVGSGRGLTSFTQRSSSNMGIPATTETVPYTTPAGGPACVPPLTSPDAKAATPATGLGFDCALPNPPSGYSRHHYSSSEAPLFQTNATTPVQSLNCYQGLEAGCADQRVPAGPALQAPFAVAPVNIAYNLPGFGGTLRLSRNTYCGIFTNAITNWNDARITADNGGSVTGGASRVIKKVRRSDSSGTTFLFVNHLATACATTSFPSSIQVATAPANWPTANYYAAAGNAGVGGTVAEEPWTIGYVSPSFSQFPDATGVITIDVPTTLNLVDGNGANPITVSAGVYNAASPATLQNRANRFRTPTLANATSAMNSATPPSGAAAANAANWAAAGLVPDPTTSTAYPIAGFAWLMQYTCYSSSSVVSGVRGWWNWNIRNQGGGNLDARDLLRDRGFAILPTAWRTAVKTLLIDNPATRISGVSGSSLTNPACAGKAGA